MNAVDRPFVWAVVVSGAIYVVTFLAVLLDRARYERRRRVVVRLTDMVAGTAGERLGPQARLASAGAYLSTLRRRRIERIVAETALPAAVEEVMCRYLLAQHGLKRVRLSTVAHRGEASRWARIVALRVLAVGAPDEAWPALERALSDPDLEVVGAAVTILGGMADPRAGELLAEALRAGRYPRSRVASFLERSERDLSALIRPLLSHSDEMLRYWGALLLRRHPSVEGTADLARLTRDGAPLVRRAALESLAAIGGPEAVACARARLSDDEWLVRAHAAHALGVLRDVDGARLVAPLLAEREWWVRSAAKAALEAMGPDVIGHVLPLLTHSDKFARNGAAEVLQNLGAFERLLTEAVDGGADERLRALLDALARAGGVGMLDAVLDRLTPGARDRARDVLAALGLERSGAAAGDVT